MKIPTGSAGSDLDHHHSRADSLSIDDRWNSLRSWSYAHDSVVGGGIILFGLVIPPRLGLAMDFSVGLMLVLLGMFNLNAFWESLEEIASGRSESAAIRSHFYSHEHDEPCQPQAHGDAAKSWNRIRLYRGPPRDSLSSLSVRRARYDTGRENYSSHFAESEGDRG